MLQKYYEPIFIVVTLVIMGLILAFFAQYSCLNGSSNDICILSPTQYRIFLGIVFLSLVGYVYLLLQNTKKGFSIILFFLIFVLIIFIVGFLSEKI